MTVPPTHATSRWVYITEADYSLNKQPHSKGHLDMHWRTLHSPYPSAHIVTAFQRYIGAGCPGHAGSRSRGSIFPHSCTWISFQSRTSFEDATSELQSRGVRGTFWSCDLNQLAEASRDVLKRSKLCPAVCVIHFTLSCWEVRSGVVYFFGCIVKY